MSVWANIFLLSVLVCCGLKQTCHGVNPNKGYNGVDPARPAQIVEGSEHEINLPGGQKANVFRAKFFLDVSLYDGQNMFTLPSEATTKILPNDFSILKQTSFKFTNRDTGKKVSMDEVYFHHINFFPMSMMGAEVLSRTKDDPFFEYPPGYGFFMNTTETPHFTINAHLLSQKNLKAIKGNEYLAKKHCNECRYSPTKGPDCTPEVDGSFKCCGDSEFCMNGGDCYCETTMPLNTTKRVPYTAELELLVTYETEKFVKVEQIAYSAPKCVRYQRFLEPYPANDYCVTSGPDADPNASDWKTYHNVYENATHPLVRTVGRWVLGHGGRMVWATPHLHTGGVNATIRINGEVVCSSMATHGNSSNVETNAGNEYGHLVRIDDCISIHSHPEGVRFEKDDVLEVESIYNVDPLDNRLPPGTGGTHTNAMSLLFTATVLDPVQRQHLEESVQNHYSSLSVLGDWLERGTLSLTGERPAFTDM